MQSRVRKKVTIIAIIVAAALFCAAALYFGVLARKARRFSAETASAATEYGVDETLILAVISVESDFQKNAVSRKGAIGLMQVMPQTARFMSELSSEALGELDLFEPRDNVTAGTAYLRYLLDKFGDKDTALAAYNGGEGNVSRWLNDKSCSTDGKTLVRVPFPETRRYIKKVKAAEKRFALLFNAQNALFFLRR